MSLISVDKLAVFVGDTCLLEPISFTLEAGEKLTILGQTGSGKSLLAQAIMGNLPKGLRTEGEIRLFNSPASAKSRRELWGRRLSMLPQEPWNALNPLMSAKAQLAETYHRVRGDSYDAAQQNADYTLELQGLGESRHKRVDQLSGGMAQRVAIACAMAGGAPLLLADEPTKGLDVNRRDQVVEQLISQSQTGALVTITHDVAVARQTGGRLMVIKSGELIEHGEASQILNNPQQAFTRELIAADPQSWPTPERKPRPETSVLMETESLAIGRGEQTLAKDLSFKIHRGEVIGVVGDSGCGKSTLGDTLLGLQPSYGGKIKRHCSKTTHRWQKLYQDPTAAVSHAVSLGTLLNDTIKRHRIDKSRVAPLMERLGLAEALLTRRADSVSGGELQRFCMLRALLLDPVFLFADEPTSRLDPITAQSVSQLLVDVARETNCAVMLVSHDPHLIEKRCDRVVRI
ncbi:ABC transporter ATP-binding protein [Marinobacterium lutimaris]|uniref:Peptide/nickel transport system ATP-binding protein n=1 Tax=Marinobacterium lutimaris TaxID=568106 RepID=A0A1H5W6G1_9GAMM|nr:ATP-binding cassette domain-containing protein [Marinobacterium lutimaris]SEF95094.1 peptide/nickel transport system ATP-binding protein [Marinobacterium lutimaris]